MISIRAIRLTCPHPYEEVIAHCICFSIHLLLLLFIATLEFSYLAQEQAVLDVPFEADNLC